MSWEQRTLELLRTTTEKKLQELRVARGWTPEGPWKECLEANSSKPLRVQLQLDDYDASSTSESSSDVSGSEGENPTNLLRQPRTEGTSRMTIGRSSWRLAPEDMEEEEDKPREISLDLMETPWSRPHLNSDTDPISKDSSFAWLQYMRFFRWGQLCTIATHFNQEVSRSGIMEKSPDTIGFVGIHSLRKLTADCVEDCFNIHSVNQEGDVVASALRDIKNPDNMYSFMDVVRCVALCAAIYQDSHSSAGFDYQERRQIEDIFEEFVGEGVRELHPTKVFPVLAELGIATETVADQINIIRVCDDVDQNKSESLDFVEFLHLYRRLRRDNDYTRRNNELQGIVNSGFQNMEIDGFRTIFDLASTDYGDHTAIPVKDMLDQFQKLDVKFARSDRIQVCKWVEMVDQNGNGALDFGEFCCLMRLIWETNLGSVKKMADAKAAESNRDPDVFPPSRQDLSWVILMAEAQTLEQYETVSKSGFKQIFGKAIEEIEEEKAKEPSTLTLARRPSHVRFSNALPALRRRATSRFDLDTIDTNQADPTGFAPTRKTLHKAIQNPQKPRRMSAQLMQMCAGIGDAPTFEKMMQQDQPKSAKNRGTKDTGSSGNPALVRRKSSANLL